MWAVIWQNQQNECVPSEDSDQPGHPPSLIRVFTVCMKNAWVLSYPLSAQQRLWPDWADAQADLSLPWAQTHFVGFVMSLLMSFNLKIITAHFFGCSVFTKFCGTSDISEWLAVYTWTALVTATFEEKGCGCSSSFLPQAIGQQCKIYTRQKIVCTLGSFGEFCLNLEWMHLMICIIV